MNLDQLIKTHTPPAPVSSQSNVTVPVTTCPVFVRIQPCLAALPWFASTGSFSKARIGEKEAASGSDKEHKDKELHLFFMIMLQDPSHGLSHRTMSQAVPKAWSECRLRFPAGTAQRRE